MDHAEGDMGDVGVKIIGWTAFQVEVLFAFLEEHFDGPAYLVDLQGFQKGEAQIGGHDQVPFTLGTLAGKK